MSGCDSAPTHKSSTKSQPAKKQTSTKRKSTTQAKKPQNLHGPVSLYYMTHPKFPHKVCLLGDHHVIRPEPCPHSVRVDDWIYEMAQSGMNLDIFFEAPFPHKNTTIQQIEFTLSSALESYLKDARLKFDPSCYHQSKSNCKIKNSRLHYVDFRNLENDNIQPTIEILQNFKDVLIGLVDGTDLLQTDEETFINPKMMPALKKHIKSWLKNDKTFIKTVRNKTKMRKLLHNQFVIDKINKQLASFPPERHYMKDIILKKLTTTEKELFDKFPEVTKSQYDALVKFIDSKDDNVKKLKEVLFPFVYMYLHVVMTNFYGDTYLVARMLRTYKNGPPSENSIVYMGDNHTIYIWGLLKELGFQTKYQVINPEQCLNISKLKLFE